MADDTEELGEIEFDPPISEVYPWSSPSGKGGMYVFPHGVRDWAIENEIGLLHIDTSTGAVTAQAKLGEPFLPIDKRSGIAKLSPVKE